MRRIAIALGVALGFLLPLGPWSPAGVGGPEVARASHVARPNVVVVMTDDQSVETMRAMSQTRALLGQEGTTFSNSFVNNPLCCPSRATLLTGQYGHNHGVLSGSGFKDVPSSNTLPVWLRTAGYTTGHVGKYVNGYGNSKQGGPTLVPPGWSEWYGAVPDPQHVYDYDLNENGTLVHYGSTPADFKGDVITRKAVDFIRRRAPSTTPFFLNVAYTAPHNAGTAAEPCVSAAKPAPRHVGAFSAEPLPQPPSFNEEDVADKHQGVRDRPPLSTTRINGMTKHYRCRLESLLHVDEGVADLVGALRDAGELDATHVIFTSDNGFLLGEHRIPNGKLDAYDESIRVPLLMRGPHVPVNETAGGLAVNADLTRTILEVTGAQPGWPQDGISLFDVISQPERSRELVIQNALAIEGRVPYMGLRTRRYLYVEYANGERELFDQRWDPYQLDSRHEDLAYANVVEWMAQRLGELRACEGATCQASAGEPPAPADRIVTAAPDTAVIESGGGSLRAGTGDRLEANDSSFYEVNSTTSGTRTTSWYGSFSGVPNGLQALRVSYSGRNSRTCSQTVAIWRWTDSTWVQIDPLSGSRSVGTTKVTLSTVVPADSTLADYVSGDSGTGELRVRVRCTRSSEAFFAGGDFMQIQYERPLPPPVVDTAPETTIDSGPDALTTSRDASFNFSANEPATFECSLDGAAFTACTPPRNYTGLAVGAHEFRVQATDTGGRTDTTPATYPWTICPGVKTAAADADSWVLQSSGTSNYGTDSVLKVDSKVGDNARALVRFNLPGVPSGCQVTNAKLRLYAGSYKEGRTLRVLHLGGAWTENGVTWNNQPATTGAAVDAASRQGYVEWNVTAHVHAMYSGANHGFLVRDATEGGSGGDQGFHSREKGTDRPPELIITAD